MGKHRCVLTTLPPIEMSINGSQGNLNDQHRVSKLKLPAVAYRLHALHARACTRTRTHFHTHTHAGSL